jgi:signal transduction histidine kinase
LAAVTWCLQSLILTQFYLTEELSIRIWFPSLLNAVDILSVIFQFTCIFILINSVRKTHIIIIGVCTLIGLFTGYFFDLLGAAAIIFVLIHPTVAAWICYPHIKNSVAAKFVFFGVVGFGGFFFLFLGFALSFSFISSVFFNLAMLSIPISISMAISQNFRSLNLDLLKRIEDNTLLAKEKEEILTNQNTILEEKVKTRTGELETSLRNLKITQSQLIQSEKMASLGELTAGIAHEIQNPLNFVNNFSEVNSELIAEMKGELEKGHIETVKNLANDIDENERKIVHHGKRADAIVKSMLQHSSTGNDQKEQTDINALCNEYLRLAYHGMRAKDKSFSAKIQTEFDPSVPKTKVVAQDIGRVILNLINNSFYAVSEKSKHSLTDYEPSVTVSTRKLNSSIEISVADNGNGIPDSLKEKIFQPFFTTKPTGQGTGLGLSLGYDIIVKGHQGELKVVTNNESGCVLVIQLPVLD